MAKYTKRVELIASDKDALNEISKIMENCLKAALNLGFTNSTWGQDVIVKVNTRSHRYFGINVLDIHSIDVTKMHIDVIEFAEELGKVSPMVGALVEMIKGREEH